MLYNNIPKLQRFFLIFNIVALLGEMQRTTQQSGDLWEDSGGPGARSHQADEFHVLSGNLQSQFSLDCWLHVGWVKKKHKHLIFSLLFLSCSAQRSTVSAEKSVACVTPSAGKTLSPRPTCSHSGSSSTCSLCWTSSRTWSAASRTTTPPTKGIKEVTAYCVNSHSWMWWQTLDGSITQHPWFCVFFNSMSQTRGVKSVTPLTFDFCSIELRFNHRESFKYLSYLHLSFGLCTTIIPIV